jgi:hypothetical protein
MIVTTSGSWSLSADEVATMSYTMWRSKMVETDSQTATDLINKASNAIATAHGVDPSSPFQIVMDISWTLSFSPAWTTVAGEGDTITVKAGTTIRYGVPAGTACGYAPACGATPLDKDVWQTVTLAQDTTFVVGPNSGPLGADPCYGYTKVVQVLGGATGGSQPPTA